MAIYLIIVNKITVLVSQANRRLFFCGLIITPNRISKTK
mgnify:CR=1 FL=1